MYSSLTALFERLTPSICDVLGYPILTEGHNLYISGRLLTSNYPTEAYFDVIRRWLEDCTISHPSCGDHSLSPPGLPDRVIDVALLGGNVRLIDGSGMFAQYATLSHCWGGKSNSGYDVVGRA